MFSTRDFPTVGILAVGGAAGGLRDALRLRLDVLVKSLLVRGLARAVMGQVVALNLEALDAESHVVNVHQLFHQLTHGGLHRRLVQELVVLRLLQLRATRRQKTNERN